VVASALGLALAAWFADPLEILFNGAARALQAGDLPTAERGFREVLRAQPNHIGALGNLGVVYSRMDRPADAVDVYRRAMRLAPDVRGLWLNLGLAHLKLDDYAAAKPLFEKVEASPLRSAQSTELLATCRVYTGEPEAGLAALETLPRSTGTLFLMAVANLKLKRPDRARDAFAELMNTAPPAQAQFLLGRAYAENDLFDDARAAFQKAAEIDPKLPSLELEMGKVSLAQRDNESAEKHLRAALDEQAGSAEASYFLGALLAITGRGRESIPFLDRARTSRPDGWGSYYYLGRARLQLNESAAAVAMLEQAAKLNPSEGSIHYQLARAYQSAGRPQDAQRARSRVAQLRGQGDDEDRVRTGR
jgi:tetratricopeptide (TPR) repeat protein